MNRFLSALVLLALYCTVESIHSGPTVQVYSVKRGEFNMANVLICHVANFHPPDIEIQLLKDGNPLPNQHQTDLSFDDNWRFRLTRSAPFTPQEGLNVTCKVTHSGKVLQVAWESNM